MSKIITKLSSKNQVTIPVELMRQLNFPPQTKLLLQVIDGALVIKESKSPIDIVAGWAKKYVKEGVDTSTWSSDVHAMRNIERQKWNEK